MNSSLWAAIIIVILIAAWYAWRYYRLRRKVDEYAIHVRGQDMNTNVRELENLSSAISSLIATFNTQHAALESERLRLATVLDQITDGVLIADATGLVQFANPAAGRLFQFGNPLHHSIVEVVRNHQLVEAWRRGAPRYAMVHQDADRLRGFCLGRAGSRREHLGPLVAEDFPAARALLLSALAGLENRAVLLDVPLHDPAWLALLDDLGFRTERPFIRMARGPDRSPGDLSLEWAIAGPEVG